MSTTAQRAKRAAADRMRKQAEDLLTVAFRAHRSGFYDDGARAAQHLKHVFECLAQTEQEEVKCP
jgi:hypothetical protein